MISHSTSDRRTLVWKRAMSNFPVLGEIPLEFVTHFVLALYLPSDFRSVRVICREIFPSPLGERGQRVNQPSPL